MVPSPLKSVLSSGQTESSASVQAVPNGHKELCWGSQKDLPGSLCPETGRWRQKSYGQHPRVARGHHCLGPLRPFRRTGYKEKRSSARAAPVRARSHNDFFRRQSRSYKYRGAGGFQSWGRSSRMVGWGGCYRGTTRGHRAWLLPSRWDAGAGGDAAGGSPAISTPRPLSSSSPSHTLRPSMT